jgi:hypothetical protein
MPYFFVGAFWILCCGIGLVSALFKQSRFLALHLILGSTGGAIFSVVVPTILVVSADYLFPHGAGGWFVIAALTISFFGGGAFGGALGLLSAHRLNTRFGWTKPGTP